MAAPANAHRMKAGATEVAVNDRTGELEIIHLLPHGGCRRGKESCGFVESPAIFSIESNFETNKQSLVVIQKPAPATSTVWRLL